MSDQESMQDGAAMMTLPAARTAIMQSLGLTQPNEALTIEQALRSHGVAAGLLAMEVARALLTEGAVRGVGNLRLTPMEVWIRCINNPPRRQVAPAVAPPPHRQAVPAPVSATQSTAKRPQRPQPSSPEANLLRPGQHQQLVALIEKRGWTAAQFVTEAKKPLDQLTTSEATAWIAKLIRATYGKPRPKTKAE